ncbi:hypothetical protein N7468_006398 [Penicillium chermesinum]|uniref:F-box domain-containing protein n=1 Tax=Penicillium chermesinum TaxID=63820 RepID=A0A9W9NUE9_9EURO|nr:uncharacterized protein N7468_006398 [Penicillium chermesinum]KAJ5225173.1 hypothetical protein N7468_006398 [Penicillium chermesinum]
MSDSDVEAILTCFRGLPRTERRAVIHGILDGLDSSEWMSVKARTRERSYCDILGKLPIELVALVAGNLPLVDIIKNQRVSRRWRQILSSAEVKAAAIKAAFDPGEITVDLNKLIRQRVRIERGDPVSRSRCRIMPPADARMIHLDDSLWMDCTFNGVAAWHRSNDRTIISLFDAKNGERSDLCSENRESLHSPAMSEALVAAVSNRGHCHVWSIVSHEYRSFRLPSASFTDVRVNGSNVMVAEKPSRNDSMVSWEWESGIAETRALDTAVWSASKTSNMIWPDERKDLPPNAPFCHYNNVLNVLSASDRSRLSKNLPHGDWNEGSRFFGNENFLGIFHRSSGVMEIWRFDEE